MDIDKLLAETQWLRALARTLVQDEDRAEEITQETFLVALKKSPSDVGGLRGWLRSVLRLGLVRGLPRPLSSRLDEP